MAHQMHRLPRVPDHLFKNFGFVTNVAIDQRAPLGGLAVTQQAGCHTAEATAQMRYDRPPRDASAAGPRHQHDGRTLPNLVVVDIASFIFDHGWSFANEDSHAAADRGCRTM